MSVSINGTSGLVFNDATTQQTAPKVGMVNRLINGDFRIDQRNAGASVTPTVQGQYTLDRWNSYITQASKYSIQQNAGAVTPPVGFPNYAGITSLSSYSVTSTDGFALQQRIEGFNVADLGWGTANAQTVTLSFWVRSSLTGTFGGSFYNSAANRFYPFSYTISSANTWEQKSITVVGDTTGTWLTTNGVGVLVSFGLGAGATLSQTAGAWTTSAAITSTGATSVVGTNGATFYITGVQLEKGSTATSFDYRPYTTELQLCQRYYQQYTGTGTATGIFGRGNVPAGSAYPIPFTFPVTMRTTPTVAIIGTWTVSNSVQPAASGPTPSMPGLIGSSVASGDSLAYASATNQGFSSSAEL
jgi:hypothetical protein